jgi:hypothetical protein
MNINLPGEFLYHPLTKEKPCRTELLLFAY